jgi:mono/diheme cytochrome c family protein
MTATASPFQPAFRCLAIVSLILLTLSPIAAREAQIGSSGYFVPGDPKAGIRIFFDKGCARCHAVLGEGGRSAPDLARSPAGHLSAAELVSAMWNHAPAMWQKMRLERLDPPKFTAAEMTDLFAFLYSIRSLDEPGDPQRGRTLLEERKCLSCHSVSGKGGGSGPDLRQWGSYRNPVSWVQAMWNHGTAMQAMLTQRGLGWPQFQGSDMADLIAYVHTLTAKSGPRTALRQADPESGQRVFLAKRCDGCHAIRGAGATRGPDLGSRNLPRTLGQFAGTMWNHAPTMWNSMRVQGLTRPQFSNQEMADLIAYLFTQRYFEISGRSDRGERLFADKGCAGCHAPGGPAPSLAQWKGSASAVAMATALWNHGPLMFASMQQHRFSWPRFAPGEVVDIMEFLNRGAPPRVETAHNKRSQP